MPTRCNIGFYCRSYFLLNMFRASLCPSSGAQDYYTVVAACGISCCKNVKNNFVSFCRICVLSLKCRVLSRFVTRCVASDACNCPPRPQSHNHTLQTGYLTHRPSYTLQKKTHQEHPHTAPTTFDTPSNKPR